MLFFGSEILLRFTMPIAIASLFYIATLISGYILLLTAGV